MCTVSMVTDRAIKVLPWDQDGIWHGPFPPPNQKQQALEKMELWEKYKRLMEAAKEIDHETKQPDCEDAEKIAALEKIIFDLAERVKQLEAGKFDADAEIKRLHEILGKHATPYAYEPSIPLPATASWIMPPPITSATPSVQFPDQVISGQPFGVLAGTTISTIDPNNITIGKRSE